MSDDVLLPDPVTGTPIASLVNMPFLLTLLSLLFLTGNAFAQDLVDRAERAVEDALLQPLAERPATLLRAAQAFVGTPAGDRALVVGLGYTATLLRGRGEVRQIDAGIELVEDERAWERGEVAKLLPDYEALLNARRDELAPEQRRLVTRLLQQRIRLSTPPLGPAFVRPGTDLPIPELAVEMTMRVWPWQQARPLQDATKGPPSRNREITLGRGRPVEALPRGVWMAHIEEDESGFAARRIVAVTDLEAEVILGPDGVVVFVHRGGEPVADAQVCWAEQATTSTDERGIVAVPRSEGTTTLSIAFGDEHIVQDLWHYWRRAGEQSTRAHLIVDSPLYRPGHTIRGRLLARQLQPRHVRGPLGLDVPASDGEPDAGARYELRFEIPDCDAITVTATSNSAGVVPFSIEVPSQAGSGDVAVQVRRLEVRDGEIVHDTVLSARPATITHYRRAPQALELDVPQQLHPGAHEMVVTAVSTWANGAPAVGRTVRLQVKGSFVSGRTPAATEGRTDSSGRCAFEVAVAEGDQRWLSFSASADECKAQASVADVSVEQLTWSVGKAGQPARISVAGTPGDRVLVALFREVPIWAMTTLVGPEGFATATFSGVDGLEGGFDLVSSCGGQLQRREVTWFEPKTLASVGVVTAQRNLRCLPPTSRCLNPCRPRRGI